jgi:bifunctional non-homologous end joining protein LigD
MPAGMRYAPIIPTRRAEAFDDPAWCFELKFDGFRCIAETIDLRLISKQQNRMKRFEPLLGTLPYGYIFDGEIVCLDETGRPVFNDLLFWRREPVYVAFDVLNVEGADVRGMPLKDRRAILDRILRHYRMQKSELFFGCGKSLFNAVCEFDLEGIIGKRLADPYDPDRTKWWKILNPCYSQKDGRAELFDDQHTGAGNARNRTADRIT